VGTYLVISIVVFALASWESWRDGARWHAAVLAALAVYGLVCAFSYLA
jgi:hypothetical protein